MTEIKSMTCPNCGSPAPSNIIKGKIVVCEHCSTPMVWPGDQVSMILRSGEWLCLNCGTDNEKGRNVCKNCGESLVKECPVCDAIYFIGDNYCPNGHEYKTELRKTQEEAERARARQKEYMESLSKKQIRKSNKYQTIALIIFGLLIFALLSWGILVIF